MIADKVMLRKIKVLLREMGKYKTAAKNLRHKKELLQKWCADLNEELRKTPRDHIRDDMVIKIHAELEQSYP